MKDMTSHRTGSISGSPSGDPTNRLLEDLSVSDLSFLRGILVSDRFSDFSMQFALRFSYSFLQSHNNPVPAGLKNARYHQLVFAPDISIF